MGDRIPLHTHDVDEAITILAGTAHARLGDEARRLGPGAILFIPAGTPHGTANAGDEPLQIHAVFPATTILIAMLERNPAPGTEAEAPRTCRYDLRTGDFEPLTLSRMTDLPAGVRAHPAPMSTMPTRSSRRRRSTSSPSCIGPSTPIGEAADRTAYRRQERLDAGEMPDFLPNPIESRDPDWRVAPAPPDFDDRRVEITGPAEPKMMINALNSGASVFMCDFEDALSPTWDNVVTGHWAVSRSRAPAAHLPDR